MCVESLCIPMFCGWIICFYMLQCYSMIQYDIACSCFCRTKKKTHTDTTYTYSVYVTRDPSKRLALKVPTFCYYYYCSYFLL